jgi:hypothetical protein
MGFFLSNPRLVPPGLFIDSLIACLIIDEPTHQTWCLESIVGQRKQILRIGPTSAYTLVQVMTGCSVTTSLNVELVALLVWLITIIN